MLLCSVYTLLLAHSSVYLPISPASAISAFRAFFLQLSRYQNFSIYLFIFSICFFLKFNLLFFFKVVFLIRVILMQAFSNIGSFWRNLKKVRENKIKMAEPLDPGAV